MNRTFLRVAAIAATMVGLVGCEESLAVTNPNQGETARVLATADDAEALLGTYYKRWSSGVYGSVSNLEAMTSIMSFMNYSSLANNCANARTPFSGADNTNNAGNPCAAEQYRLFSYMGEVNRVAASFLTELSKGLKLGSDARTARDKAFAEFLRGMSIGYAALMHDSVAVVSEGMDAQDKGKLVSYKVAADSAYAAFQRAVDLANSNATGDRGFPLPDTWIPSPTSMTKVEFVKLVRSYRARIRANMARTPAERGAADWDAIIADAKAGITADHEITTSTTVGPGYSWRQQWLTFTTWHQVPPFFIGMADTSGSYADWIATPVGDRGAGSQNFMLVTPDQRFPQGTTRADQQNDFKISSCQVVGSVCKRYFVNRPNGGDAMSGFGFGWSNYDFVRFYQWNVTAAGTARNGPVIFMTKAEIDMLQAEGLYRKGDLAGAAALVNITRVKNGLPAITNFTTSAVVPGNNACVPKVPKAPAFNTVGCGTLWDALKYEKRIETAYTHYSAWFLDGRGWGELAKDTPLFWAVPYQELLARGYTMDQLYGAGPGVGTAPNSAAGVSVYGW